MKFVRNVKIFRGQIDLAPLAGLFFLLVLFWLLQSPLFFAPGLSLNLPALEGPAWPGVAAPTVVVALDLRGQLYYEGQVISAAELKRHLTDVAHKIKEVTLVVQADKSVSVEALSRLSKLIRDAGIRRMVLATRPGLFPQSAPALP